MRHAAITLIAVVALLSGCARVPQEAVDEAQASLAAAEAEEADLYVADLYAAAQDSFAAAQTEIEAQNAKSRFTRDYDRADRLLAYATRTATEAQSQVESRKEEMRTSNEALFTSVEEAIARARELTAQAPRGKEGAIALASIQEDAGTAAQTLADARAAQAAGQYVQAHDLAQAALEKAEGLVDELSNAIARTRPAPRL